ncbi:chromate transporter [Breoghania corrubedonensis]|uniref:Chromate transporter n=1 Tax=Breoghania corrubedonensis TaxID=665038 RepID=A0A2T5VHQ3_9HYPH|nr:chromate efflux transporter [Breoghania corrubedonensis]PTW63280.1 chromate transporter [Breoghania corrubedonensis]
MTRRDSAFSIFLIFLRLGLTSFGGPIAHLGYYRREFVDRRRWIDDQTYADLVALSQFLPGPASSQTGFAIGLMRGGLRGAVAAFLGFTLPSAAIMLGVAYGSVLLEDGLGGALVHGLKLVAVAVVAQAVQGMARNLCPDAPRAAIAFFAMALVLLSPGSLVQLAAMLLAGLVGLLACRDAEETRPAITATLNHNRAAVLALLLFATLLFALPQLSSATNNGVLRLADIFYQAGALVFGGGHVVLPLLQATTVETGLVGGSDFLAGYGAAQALPGPLFAFSAYLGALMPLGVSPPVAAMVALLAIFLPGFLLVYGALPFWQAMRASGHVRGILKGVNAGVVGLLAAAFYDPIWTSSILSPLDLVLAGGAFLLLTVLKQGSGRVVAAMLASSTALHFSGVF